MSEPTPREAFELHFNIFWHLVTDIAGGPREKQHNEPQSINITGEFA